jgi:hypothetical protein
MICTNCESTEFTCGGCGINLQPAATYTAAEVKVLTEKAGKFGYVLGRKEALEEAAVQADWLAEGVANPEKPYNEAFIHACGVVARHIRSMASQPHVAASDAISGVPRHSEVSEAAHPGLHPLQSDCTDGCWNKVDHP